MAALLMTSAAIVVAILTLNSLIVAAFAGLYVLVDWLLHRLAIRRRGAPIQIEFTLHVEGDASLAIAGCTIRMEVTLTAGKRLSAGLVLPLVPAAMQPLDKGGARLTFADGARRELVFRFRAAEAAHAVFPGIAVCWPSPLRLFSRRQLAPCRQQITVMPDYLSATQPQVAKLLRRMRIGEDRKHVIRGFGTDFHQLRPYNYPDSITKVDWKATARRSALIVREYQEPREFTIRIVLDGSLEMTHSDQQSAGFAPAATFIARLAFIASVQGMNMMLWAYDRSIVHEARLGPGVQGFARFISQLMAQPRQALLRRALDASSDVKPEALHAKASAVLQNWGVNRNESLEQFCARYFARDSFLQAAAAELMADLNPSALAAIAQRCQRCGHECFADESACSKCDHALGEAQLPARASCAAAVLARSIRKSRGREMLLFISALQGGEACQAITQLLKLAACGHRSVHVVLPSPADLKSARPSSPGSLGHQPVAFDVLANLDRLNHFAHVADFRKSLADAAVKVHTLGDEIDLDEVVASVLLQEVLAA